MTIFGFIKRTVFWILFVPICILLFVLDLPEIIFSHISNIAFNIASKYEHWTFDIKRQKV